MFCFCCYCPFCLFCSCPHRKKTDGNQTNSKFDPTSVERSTIIKPSRKEGPSLSRPRTQPASAIKTTASSVAMETVFSLNILGLGSAGCFVPLGLQPKQISLCYWRTENLGKSKPCLCVSDAQESFSFFVFLYVFKQYHDFL